MTGTQSSDRSERADVVIVGAGIIGSCLAYDLERRGVRVALVDRREVGREASWASAGIINAPGPRLGTKADLALRSFRRFPGLVAEVEDLTGISTEWVNRGMIYVATESNGDALRRTLRWQGEHGLSAEWLDRTELRRRESGLRDAFAGALFNPQASSLLLGQFTRALARAAELNGATIREHTLVTGIETTGGKAVAVRTVGGEITAGSVVITAGAWSRMFGESLDFPIPTRPVRGQMLAVTDAPVRINSAISGEGGYLVPRADGSIAVGATEERDAGFDADVTPAGIAWLAALIDRLVPSLNAGRLVASWAGLRPASEDGELIVGRVPLLENVWVATGHFRSGALLGPATSELLAESIVTGTLDPALAPFDPKRFA